LEITSKTAQHGGGLVMLWALVAASGLEYISTFKKRNECNKIPANFDRKHLLK